MTWLFSPIGTNNRQRKKNDDKSGTRTHAGFPTRIRYAKGDSLTWRHNQLGHLAIRYLKLFS